MRFTRTILLVVGLLMILLGVVWIGQGSGYFPYPASSFMINQTPWIYWGIVMAAAGLAIVMLSRRSR